MKHFTRPGPMTPPARSGSIPLGAAVLAMLAFASLAPGAEESPAPLFESDIAPILATNCLVCHTGDAPQAGLDLGSRESLLAGGKSGPAVVPGVPSESLLLQKAASGAMPPGDSHLETKDLTVLRSWIEAGALVDGEEAGTGAHSGVNPREILVTTLHVKCLLCHGRRNQEGGLDLRTRESTLLGGASGPAIVPGDPDASLLIRRIEAEEMPPTEHQARLSYRPVTSTELEALRRWISEGAPWDVTEPPIVDAATDPMVSDEDRKFWSFQSPRRQTPPSVGSQPRVRQPIDAFLLARLEEAGLTFAPDADRLTLMRRAWFDVTGLPPSPDDVRTFLDDTAPGSYERLVEKLLESPQYGEHWGRRWLDAAGYADSEGQVDFDAVRPHAWRYRDWVVRALNADKPYDEFLTEQIAGDELFDYRSAARPLSQEDSDRLVATGFLRMGPDGTYSVSQGFVAERMTVVADQLQILTSTVMGLTVGCARCHDHKYDPIPQRDYYRLSAILRSAYDPYDWLSPNEADIGPDADWNPTNTRLMDGATAGDLKEATRKNAPVRATLSRLAGELAQLPAPLRTRLLEEKVPSVANEALVEVRDILSMEDLGDAEDSDAGASGPAGEDDVAYSRATGLLEEYVRERLLLATEPRIRALFDMGGTPTPVHILFRGDHRNPGAPVGPGVPSVLGVGLQPYTVEALPWSSGRRLGLAKWLVQEDHPLTARVMVNRVWQHYFGRGIVPTAGNFGLTGTPPTHPQLLDWLAVEFAESGWSLKDLHRLILTSTAYRQSSRLDTGSLEGDADNTLLSRFPLRRLDADAIRDSVLRVSGRLDPRPFGPPEEIEVRPDGEVIASDHPQGQRRSLYIQQRRSRPMTMLEAFDAPQLKPNCLQRTRSTVASQALQMMNSEMLRANARFMAGRVMDAVGGRPGDQVQRTYLAALGRPPSDSELADAVGTLEQLTAAWTRELDEERPLEPTGMRARWLALSALCHTVLNSAEFLYID